MKLVMHKQSNLKEERVEVYYKEMNSRVQKVVDAIEEHVYIQAIQEGEKYTLPIDTIYYFDTVDKLSFAYQKDQVYRVPYTLGEIEESLKDQAFVRISKASIVNIYRVERIVSELNMRIKVYLENGEALLVSRHYKKGFEEALRAVHKQLRGGNQNEMA
ncbi:MAG: LytTR family DNA-binding domain-containing protein [Cellulosilyticaceae bacterium]